MYFWKEYGFLMWVNEKSFRTIYDTYYHSICRFLNYYTHDPYAIEEVVQDVFVKLWNERNLKDIKFIKTYLFKSARNRMLNFLRDNNNREILLNKWAQKELEENKGQDCVNRDEFFLLLQEAVENLPPKCKEIFILNREENMTYREIAELRNISIKTVENQMGIALKKIQTYIESRNSSLKMFLFFI